MKNLYLIAAIGKNKELGYKNDLIWRLKEDLQFFKEKTMNSYVIMGKNTYHSLPKKLKDRKYIVLCDDDTIKTDEEKIVFKSIQAVLGFVKENKDQNFFVIGGGMVYKQFINHVGTMYLTEIDDSYDEADIYFANFMEDDWKIEKSPTQEENGIKYNHVTYRKRGI